VEPAPREIDPALAAARPVFSAARRQVVRAFPWHVRGFVVGNLLLNGVNALTGGFWWAFWPLLVTAAVLAVHYFLYKTISVDARWVDERTEELNLKSYDRSHIEDLKSRYGGDAADDVKRAR
jgi:hypothetical protein